MAKQIPLPQEYPVPVNWCWIEMGKIVKMKTGFPFDSKRFSSESEGRRPLIRIRDVLKGETVTFTDENCPEEYIIHSGDILIGMDGDFNVAKWKSEDALLNQRVCCIESGSELLLDNYLFYYLPGPLEKINELTPSVTVKHLSTKTLNLTPLPLPPLAEQYRIVDCIESLFAKLDKAREEAQAVIDGFELRKSVILHRAFTGKLTEQWRKEHGVGLDSWKHCTVGSVCNDVKVGIVIKPSQYYTDKNEGTPAFRSANVRECRVDDFDWVYLNEEGMANNKRSIVHTGDVLIVRSGNPGTACVVTDMFDGYNAIDILIAVPNRDFVLPDFLCLFTNSPLGKKSVAEGKRGMALSHFNVKGYSKVEFDVPLIPEQKEIIHALNNFLEKEQQVKEAAEAILDKIVAMKKAILARAFRGKLGTNDPVEKGAVEMLKKIL